ncbi:MAG: 50S ribosomal protein L21e [Candidatus Aenigmatarchaeota archaeon]
MKKSRGMRIKTRKTLKQEPGYRPPVTKFLREFNIGQKVVINQEPSSHKGMPHPRYKGRVGTVIGKRGKSYIVEITNGDKAKKIISRPEHLKVVK